MVRCSIKRAIRLLIIVIILIFFLNKFFSSSKKSPEKSSDIIFILSLSNTKTIQRLILFLNEIRFVYIQYNNLNENFYQDLLNHRPTIIILDHKPTKEFDELVKQYKINLIIILNDDCNDCVRIKSSQMLFENFSYSTIDFNRNEFKPILHQISTPFKIQQSNPIIKLLRFDKLLPYFHQFNYQCLGLPMNNYDQTIIYIENKETNEKINLMKLSSKNRIYVSECLYHHWFIWPLMMDIIRYLTSNRYDYYGLKRYIQIDIDDIFLGGKDRLKFNDIQLLIHSQEFIRKFIKNFRYRLGYSGYFYDEKSDGDQYLIKKKNEFIWFHHTWKHEKLTNISQKISFIGSTETNLAFAQKYQLPLDRHYAIAPHHTGIYPINPIVYEIWHETFNFNVTSTENYPYHYDLPSNHRGFIYRGLSVLPRQSCGLYTTTRNYTNYPNGSSRLERSIMGGRLFRTILTNPISIFMSHNVNYGDDHLGNYVFSKLIYLISKWTRIEFSNDLLSNELAQKYFYEFYPNEQMPIFTNPCNDQILMNLWNGNRSLCHNFPQFIIVGPQKTGTTALHSMLSQHPDLHPSKKSLLTYEELQFFSNDKIYLNGINWYLEQFDTSEQSINFEKSATYFDSILSIKRIKALLPNVRLIMIFTEPGARAYSRYQHEIVRMNLTFSFDYLIQTNHEKNSEEFHLKQRCLQPGHYAEYLVKWLKYFLAKQIYIIDGEEFRRDPRKILNDIQISFLQLKNPTNSSKLVRFNKKKGFFCSISDSNHFQCLGNSKGRKYASMSSKSREYLNNYYSIRNENLVKLLQMNNYSIPSWLSDK